MSARHFRLAALTALLGLVLPASAATLTRTSSFAYDPSSGLLTKEVIEPDNSSLCLVTEYVYDAYGNKTSATTRNCNASSGEAAAPTGDAVIAARTTSNTYDARGQFPVTSSNALSQSETKTYDPRFGTVTSLTGPNGLTTTWTYDGFGRKTLETRADGTKTAWAYLYCTGVNGGTAACPTVGGASGAYVIVTTPLASDGVTQNGPIAKTYFDGLDREIRKETQGYDGTGTSTAIYQDSAYDSLGRPYMKSRPYYAGQTIYWTTMTYDVLNRVVAVTEPDGANTTTAYSGLSVTVTNPKGQTRTTVKNSQGQVVSVTDAQNQTLAYEYDPFGNLTKTTDPLGNSTVLTYDLRGRKTQMQDPDMGVWTYAYDALGQLVRQTDAKSQVTLMTYDALGRMTSRSESDLISNWYYDLGKNNAACPKGIGKLCQAETSTGYNRVHGYDALGRPSATTTSVDTTYSDSLSYDSQGRLATRGYPGGITVGYVYTALGYLKEIRNSQTNALYWQADSLDAEGHLLAQTYGNGVQTQQTYNAANGRLLSILAGAGNAVQNLAYTYDTLGNIASRTDANQSLTEGFLYDSLNRLTSATVNSGGAGIVTQSFGYDALGNIVSRSDVGTYSYPASGATSVRPHAVSRIDLTGGGYRTYAFDANGNLVTEAQYDAANNPLANKGRTEAYTSFNMPMAFGAPGISAAYQYGPEHQRVMEGSTSNGTTIYLNPGNNGELLFEKQTKPDNSVEQRSYLTAYGTVVGVVKQVTSGGTTTTLVRFFHRDNLGSTTAVTDEAGAVIERLAYEAFGKRRFASGVVDPDNTIVPVNTERGFTNHEHIDELGLVHMNGRIYDPVIGRFVSADPNIPNSYDLQSYNRYAYVLNNPLLYTDPSGYRFSLGGLFRAAVAVAAIYYAGPIMDWAASSALATATSSAIAQGMVGGAIVGYVATGTVQGTVTGGLSGGLFGAAGDWATSLGFANGTLGHAAIDGFAGGVMSTLQGGKFSDGFIAAGAGEYLGPKLGTWGNAEVVKRAILGGTFSALGGGKFANGAMTAAYAYTFNACGAGHGGTGTGCPFSRPLTDRGLQPQSSGTWKLSQSSARIESDGTAPLTARERAEFWGDISTGSAIAAPIVAFVPVWGPPLSASLVYTSIGATGLEQVNSPNLKGAFVDQAIDFLVVKVPHYLFRTPEAATQPIAEGMKRSPEARCFKSPSEC